MSHDADPLDKAEALVLNLLETAAETMELVDVELSSESTSMPNSDGVTNAEKIVALGKTFKSTINNVETILLEESEKILQPFEDYQKERAVATTEEDAICS